MRRPKSGSRSTIDFITTPIRGVATVIRVGDDILLEPDKSISGYCNEKDYIAKVIGIAEDHKGNHYLQCRWYYRPEDTPSKRMCFHGANEVFFSNFENENCPESIQGKCRVISLQEYMDLPRVGKNDFFCRFGFDYHKNSFYPQQVEIYCCCEMPYNPDDKKADNDMFQCYGCTEWYVEHGRGIIQNVWISADGNL